MNKRHHSIKNIMLYGLMLIFMLLIIEAMSYGVGFYLTNKCFFLYKPCVSRENFEKYMRDKDEVTGWPFKEGNPDRDMSGSRYTPAFPDFEKYKPIVSVYGDSFVWSDGVDNEHAWPNVLSKLLGFRVSNFGVPAYGTDQALLRFEKNKNDQSKVVILGFWSENIVRNVNQYRDFVCPSAEVLLKPRFILDDAGQLRLIPLPELKADDYSRFIHDPGHWLKYDYFIPNASDGMIEFKFPYTLALFKTILGPRLNLWWKREMPYMAFFNKNHKSHAYDITLEIMKRFAATAIVRGKIPIILFIPDCKDLQFYEINGRWPYESLLEDVKADNIEVINVGKSLFDYAGHDDPCKTIRDKTFHYKNEGYEVIGKSVKDYLNKFHHDIK